MRSVAWFLHALEVVTIGTNALTDWRAMTATRPAIATHHAGQLILDDTRGLARRVVDTQFKRYPNLRQLFAGERYEQCLTDTAHHLEALGHTLAAGEPRLFAEYAVWVRALLAGLGLPDACLVGSLLMMREVIEADFADVEAGQAAAVIDIGLHAIADATADIESHIPDDAPLASFARGYLDALLAGDRRLALRVANDAVDAGHSLAHVYEHVFRPAQYEVGRLWQDGRISVAMEHYATGATQVVMAQFFDRVVTDPVPPPRRFVGACVRGEQHELGVRMACDVVEQAGWQVVHLGANTPDFALVAAVRDHRPHVVGLSATLPFRMADMTRAIGSLREHGPADMAIVVGGRPFNQVPDLWRSVGADGMIADMVSLVPLIEGLAASRH